MRATVAHDAGYRGGGGRNLSPSFEEAIRFLYPRTAGRIKWSLEPTKVLLEELGHPEAHFDAIHVGGTNGKGSVAVLVYEALRAAGYRTGLYTSPHLVDVRERMVIDGRPIGKEAFAMWVGRLKRAVIATDASFFEATTAIAFADFAARGVELAVVEVGLGGRLDATNVIRPVVSAVTCIRREHTEYLGEALDGIAREKAGIAKPDVPFVIGETRAELLRVLADQARAVGAVPVRVPENESYDGTLALRGAHQRRNAAVAREILRALPARCPVPEAAIRSAFAMAQLAGRFDRRGRWIFDVAHNLPAFESLAGVIAEELPPRPVHALVGILRDKEWDAMLEIMASIVDRLWLTIPPSAPPERRWDLDEVRRSVPAALQPDFAKALDEVQRGAATVLVTGSFYTVGDALARLPGFPPLG